MCYIRVHVFEYQFWLKLAFNLTQPPRVATLINIKFGLMVESLQEKVIADNICVLGNLDVIIAFESVCLVLGSCLLKLFLLGFFFVIGPAFFRNE